MSQESFAEHTMSSTLNAASPVSAHAAEFVAFLARANVSVVLCLQNQIQMFLQGLMVGIFFGGFETFQTIRKKENQPFELD